VKLRGATSCEVRFSTSLQPDKNLYVCVRMRVHSEVFVKPDGSLYVEGDLMYRKRLADTLDIIASDNGTWDMYNGSLARIIVQDLRDIGELTAHIIMCSVWLNV